MYKSALICVGNELLSGSRLNDNQDHLGLELSKLGMPLHYSVTVRDDEISIHKALEFCLENYDIVITTGGLGPTFDDITKQAVAGFLGKRMIFREEVWSLISERFLRRGKKVPEINRTQAEIPEDFTILYNRGGTSPGLVYQYKDRTLFLLPGVPAEMRLLFSEGVKPLLQDRYPSSPLTVRTIHTIDIAESELAEIIKDIDIPTSVELAFLPYAGGVDLRLSGQEQAAVDALFSSLRERSSPYVWGTDDETLPDILYRDLKAQELTLAVAESCTGGLVQKKLTDIPGISEVFKGGVIVYSNRSKMDLLGVSAECLEKYGAVSPETGHEMARGVKDLLKSDIACSITGIAGPGGGKENKPIGTLFFTVIFKEQIKQAKRIYSGNRWSIREKSAMFMLNMLRERIS